MFVRKDPLRQSPHDHQPRQSILTFKSSVQLNFPEYRRTFPLGLSKGNPFPPFESPDQHFSFLVITGGGGDREGSTTQNKKEGLF